MEFTFKSGESFSYKGWHIMIEGIYIYFSIEATPICFAYIEAEKKSGSIDEHRLKNLLSETSKLDFRPLNQLKFSI